MEYTVKTLAQLAGVSERTLRYYDQIGLLQPRRNQSGYRVYGPQEVDRLQQILFYRALELPLTQIEELLARPEYNAAETLQRHLTQLQQRRNQLDKLIQNAEKTISHLKGEKDMSDQEKFEGFKAQMVEENEKEFGEEVRQKYGDESVNTSNQKVLNMTPEQHQALERLTEEFNTTLQKAVQEGDPAGETAQKAASLHKDWLCFFWPQYTPEAHKGVALMYTQDERFQKYYEDIVAGGAEFLYQAVEIFTQG